MAFIFNFPDVGEGIHEGRVVEWLVSEGAAVNEDEALVKVETDKAVVELPSPRAGVVLKLHVAADAAIEVGDALVTIGEAGEAVPETASPAPRVQVACCGSGRGARANACSGDASAAGDAADQGARAQIGS